MLKYVSRNKDHTLTNHSFSSADPDSCNKVKELGFNTDGEYYLYLQRPTCSVPARVYCADMNSDHALEFITLLAGRSVNYGFNNRRTGAGPEKHGKTAFDKVFQIIE